MMSAGLAPWYPQGRRIGHIRLAKSGWDQFSVSSICFAYIAFLLLPEEF